jgi:predicted metalloprotease with PDZ domain
MKYLVSYTHPNNHLIDIELVIANTGSPSLEIQLPSWRPGRYELGNFAKNIQHWQAFDHTGRKLPSKKITKDRWLVETGECSEVHIKYNYFAFQLDAGGCWLDASQLYINGVHCFAYVPDRINERCELILEIPESYKVGTGLRSLDGHRFEADNYHTLVDCPLIASPTLQHNSYRIGNVDFHLWIQGECKPQWEHLLDDFARYTEEQIRTMGSFPAGDYHYLIQVLPYKFYHGVEHQNSTVLAIGPGYNLMKGETYVDFLGLSSHELFHAWNIKAIRPAEMHPYDYTRENYSRLGYVAEGVTTYYGDLFLVRSGVYTADQYFRELLERIQRHFDNYARFTMPVSEASFDTWLDGYVQGIPHRKTSIYDEGCLCALMTDLTIRKLTRHQCSLDDVMRELYTDFAGNGLGYSEQDYIMAVSNAAGKPLKELFDNFVYGTRDYESTLKELLLEAGCILSKSPSAKAAEHFFGFRTVTEGGVTKAAVIAPGSEAEKAGLSKDDEILTINGIRIENNFTEWCNYFAGGKISLGVISRKELRLIEMSPGEKTYYPVYSIKRTGSPLKEQKAFFEKWLNTGFSD